MATFLNNFMENLNEPVTVQLSDKFSDALEKMLENDFSQLPVVDDQNKPIGFVTYQSITRTVVYRQTPLEELHVLDIYEEIDKAQIFRGDETLSKMLDRLRDISAILIVDTQAKLIGIMTASDATEYLRARAENLLYVQDIESTIKDLLRFIFQQAEDEADNEELCKAIRNATQSNLVLKKEYAKALHHYLGIAGNGEVDQTALAKSYDALFGQPTEIKSFSKLTFGDFIALLLHKDQQVHFEQLFKQSPENLRKLLEDVRDTRNDLAHLREITSIQRDQLFHCKKLLDRIVIPPDWQKSIQHTPSDNLQEQQAPYPDDSTPIVPTDEESLPGQSRYSPLADWLNSQPGRTDMVQLSFEQIEKLIGGELPVSAFEHRAWWANDSQGHPHSQLWLEAGWRTNYLNRTEKVVTFVRIREREKAYIEFFSKLLAELRDKANFYVKQAAPDGANWVVCQTINSPGKIVGLFNYSFARGKRFRVELYIDTENQETTKQVFDKLYAQKAAIESMLGELSWERIDDKRASRIAVYHAGHITDDEEQLHALREWAVDKMIAFYTTLEPIASKEFQEVLAS
jgi:CBS domain-containing protein